MKIPKKVKLMGLTITTQHDHPFCSDSLNNGQALTDKSIIKIVDQKKAGYTDEKMFQIYIHEILHHCNAALNRHTQEVDAEDYVEQLSGLLAQIIPQLHD